MDKKIIIGIVAIIIILFGGLIYLNSRQKPEIFEESSLPGAEAETEIKTELPTEIPLRLPAEE